MESLGTNRSYLEEFDAHLLSVRGLLGGDAAEQGQDPHQLSLPEQGKEGVFLNLEYFYVVVRAKRRVGERGNSENVSALSARAYTKTWLVWWLHRVHMLLCPSKNFRHGNKNTHFLVRYIQGYLIIYLKLLTY
jgi:hypothetical protein